MLPRRELERADVTIDALFGTGFRGIPRRVGRRDRRGERIARTVVASTYLGVNGARRLEGGRRGVPTSP